MSYCKRDGKDTSVFVTKEDIEKPEVVTTLAEDEEYGILLPNGEINWDCLCLGGMATGPCGQEFKDAFSCFHYSEAEDKGSDCIPQFRGMHDCFQTHPEVYSKYSDEDDDDEKEENSREASNTSDKSEEEKSTSTSEESTSESSSSSSAQKQAQ